MRTKEEVGLAFDILEDADIVEVYEDSLFIKVDKALWDEFWYSQGDKDEMD